VADLPERSDGEPSTRLVIRIELSSDEQKTAAPVPPPRTNRRALPLLVCVVALAALGWGGYRWLAADAVPKSPLPPRVATVSPAATPAAVVPSVASPPTQPVASGDSAINEVLPEVSRSSLNTIRGTIRISMRVVVDPSGAVIAASPIDRGPSRYFEQRSLEASKQWKFAPATAEGQRTMRVRFVFTRGGVTASSERSK
jgi:TonB family protein